VWVGHGRLGGWRGAAVEIVLLYVLCVLGVCVEVVAVHGGCAASGAHARTKRFSFSAPLGQGGTKAPPPHPPSQPKGIVGRVGSGHTTGVCLLARTAPGV